MRRVAFVGSGLVALVMIAGLAGGCATRVSPELMVPDLPARSASQTEKTVTVAPVTGGAEANKVVVELMDQVNIGDEEFRAALIKTLETSGLFRSVLGAGTGDYQLAAHIVSQQPQRAGFLTVTSSFVVNYTMRQPGSDRDVWSDTIITHATEEGAPFSEGVPGAMKKSLGKAAQQNLAEMVEKLSKSFVTGGGAR